MTILPLPVISANAVVQPLAVVVKLLHTLVAVAAVLGADGPHSLAGVADVEDGVVHVAVIPPRRRVTNLYGNRRRRRRRGGRVGGCC